MTTMFSNATIGLFMFTVDMPYPQLARPTEDMVCIVRVMWATGDLTRRKYF